MGYSDGTLYVGSGVLKYYPCGLSSPNVHILKMLLQYFIVISVLSKTWCVDSGGYENLPCVPVITKCTYLIPHLHICYEKINLQSTS